MHFNRPGLSIFEALGKLSLGGSPLETTHTCTLFTMPSAGPLHLCCAKCMTLLRTCMTLARDCGLEIWEVNCVLRESYVAGTADRRKIFLWVNAIHG